jgi:tetratricopeptide (TPR) repeat protein
LRIDCRPGDPLDMALAIYSSRIGLFRTGWATALIALSTVGCAARDRDTAMPDFDVEVQDASVAKMDSEIHRRSASLHQYLLGQIALADERIDDATQFLRRSTELRGQPIPPIQVRLAELYLRQGKIAEALTEAKGAYERAPADEQLGLLYAGLLEAVRQEDDALGVYRALVAAGSKRSETRILMAGLLAQRGALQELLVTLEQEVATHPSQGIGHYYLGAALEKAANLTAADIAYRTATKLEPENTAAWLAQVRILLRLGKFQEAQRHAAEVVKREASGSAAAALLEQYLVRDTKFETALEALQKFSVLDESRVDTRYRLAFLNMQRSDPEGAIRELSLLLALEPEHGQARYHVGSLLAVQGRIREGLGEIAQIPPAHPMYGKSRTFAAFVQRQQGDLAGAERSIREALAQEKDSPQLVSYLVLILRDSQKYDEARDLLESALKAHPSHERLLFNYGLVLHDLGREEEAFDAMEALVAVNPEHSDALNFVAYELSVRGSPADLARAKELVERALALRATDPYYIDTLGWIYFQQGDFPAAADALERSHSLLPDDAVIAEHFVEALIAKGDPVRAMRVIRTTLERNNDATSPEQQDALKRLKARLKRLSSALPVDP